MAIETFKATKDWLLIILLCWVGYEVRTTKTNVETLLIDHARTSVIQEAERSRNDRQDREIQEIQAVLFSNDRYWQEKKRPPNREE